MWRPFFRHPFLLASGNIVSAVGGKKTELTSRSPSSASPGFCDLEALLRRPCGPPRRPPPSSPAASSSTSPPSASSAPPSRTAAPSSPSSAAFALPSTSATSPWTPASSPNSRQSPSAVAADTTSSSPPPQRRQRLKKTKKEEQRKANDPHFKHHDPAVLHEPSLSSPPNPSWILRNLPVTGGVEAVANRDESSNQLALTPMSKPPNFDEEDLDLVSTNGYDKENSRSPWPTKNSRHREKIKNLASNPDLPLYRQPDLESATLFDTELLAEFEQAVMEHMMGLEEAKRRARDRAFTMEEDEEGGENGSEEPPTKNLPTGDCGSAKTTTIH